MGKLKVYKPQFFRDPIHLLAEHKDRLIAQKGKQIRNIWVAWDYKKDEWYKELPVVVEVDNCRIELCANRIGEYSISFDEINIASGLEDYHKKLKWEKNKLGCLHKVLNQRIRSIELIESTVHVSYLKEDQLSGKVTIDYVIDGIGFNLDDGYLAICNGLDENLIMTKNTHDKTIKRTNII
ncbi:hypothetical protein AB3N04_17520 [Alkalihalophilus sp. As8PL]|uniref:Uncharacterized protein n=1 Tax=Alkalihalophilus sp. As8PL TaxID=3237103 RepID=A0AB39BSX8_9BACI